MLARRIARHFELDNTHAVRVESVQANGPAARAGVRPGDRIVRFGAAAVNGIDELHRALSGASIGARQRLSLIRDTELVVIEITPAEAARR